MTGGPVPPIGIAIGIGIDFGFDADTDFDTDTDFDFDFDGWHGYTAAVCGVAMVERKMTN